MKLTRRGLFRSAGLAAIAAVGASLPLVEQGWSLSSPSTALALPFDFISRTDGGSPIIGGGAVATTGAIRLQPDDSAILTFDGSFWHLTRRSADLDSTG